MKKGRPKRSRSAILSFRILLLLASFGVDLIFIVGFLGFSPFLRPSKAVAVDCVSVPIGGDYTVSASCSFAGTVNGVDAGTGSTNTAILTVASTVTLTILAGQTIAAGTITVNGTIAIVDTGVLRPNTPIYVSGADADGDGYATNNTQALTGTVRRNTLNSISLTDCYDSNANAFPGQTTCYTVNRGDGSFDYDCDSAATKCTNYRTASVEPCYCRTACNWLQCNTTALTSVACGAAGNLWSQASCADTAADCDASVGLTTRVKKLSAGNQTCR